MTTLPIKTGKSTYPSRREGIYGWRSWNKYEYLQGLLRCYNSFRMIKDEFGLASNEEEIQKRRKNLRKNEVSNFISKTFKILEDKDNFDTISWTDNGNSFIVKDKEKFESSILPKYFKHSKFSSFVRQLNMYDFHKLRKEKQIQVFRHKYFKMNKKELLKKIKRKCLEQNIDNEDNGQEMQPNNPKSEENEGSLQVQNQLQVIAKENQEMYKDIEQYQSEVTQYQQIHSLRREKLLKIINACVYFDMEGDANKPSCTLNSLVDHFRNSSETPHSFETYKGIIGSITKGILGQFTNRPS